jgi:hypothetical protein
LRKYNREGHLSNLGLQLTALDSEVLVIKIAHITVFTKTGPIKSLLEQCPSWQIPPGEHS